MTITADFSGGEKTVTTEPLYQWDTGQKLALSGLPATSTDIQVHFANAAMAQAIVKATATENSLPTCDIPNEFLQFGSAAKARAWVFYRASDTEGYTVRTVLIPVTPRKRPNDYVSPEDPDSHGIVDRAIELLEGYEDDLASKLSAAPGAVDTENLADESITVEKVADDLAVVINAKEVKSNKKTTLTGNESSNDFYPTTKAVADALSGKAPAATAFTFDDTTTTVTFNENNPKIIYLNATVDDEKGIVLTSADNAVQYFFGVSKSVKVRNKNGASIYTPWELALEKVGNKKNIINSTNLSSTEFYPSIKAVVDYLTANYIGNGNNTVSWDNLAVAVQTLINAKVVTDVIYSDEDLSEYSSVNSPSGRNQACVVIAPNEVDPYLLKSAQVKTKAGTPVKFSVFGISNFYSQDLMNRKRFTKVRDIVVINADDDGVARIEFDLPMRFVPDETVLVASCDTSQSSFSYGPYKDAQHTIFNYQRSWFDLQPGESDSWPFVYQTSGNSPYFVLEYVLVSNTTEIKKSAAEILQEQEYFSPYDNFVSDTSTNAVQNKVIYPFIISKDENVVNDGETTYLSAGKYNVDSLANCFAISCEAPTYGTYSVSSIEVRADNDAVITFGLWEMRFIQAGRGYWNLKQVLGTVTAANTRAKLTFQTPIVVDSSNQVIIATCPEKKIAYRSVASSPNPWKYNRIASSVFWRDDNSFSNAQVGDEVNLLLYIGVYKGWDYRENNPNTGAYEITYTPTVPEILTETRTLETCVNGLLSPIGSLRNKVWYCAGDSTTYGIEEGRSYAQIIAERNGMELWKDGISGTVMTSYPDYPNNIKLIGAFSFDRYLNIPENVDFVTLWFGINDSKEGYPVGELDSDDPATFCGAYNKVLTWIINNRPNARVGLVVTHRAGDNIKNAIRNLAKKYGLSTFDIMNDPSIPFWHPQESYGASDVSESVKTLRTSQWWYESNNCVHPLTAGYEAISYPFESWLRSL